VVRLLPIRFSPLFFGLNEVPIINCLIAAVAVCPGPTRQRRDTAEAQMRPLIVSYQASRRDCHWFISHLNRPKRLIRDMICISKPVLYKITANDPLRRNRREASHIAMHLLRLIHPFNFA
jgi:hypothetical protein